MTTVRLRVRLRTMCCPKTGKVLEAQRLRHERAGHHQAAGLLSKHLRGMSICRSITLLRLNQAGSTHSNECMCICIITAAYKQSVHVMASVVYCI
jgi:hypothetical protein